MTTDFRALCAELVETWDANLTDREIVEALIPVMDRARAALAEPVDCTYPSCVDDSPDDRCSRWLAGECPGPGARAALAVEPVGPSDAELLDAADDAGMDRFDGERSYPDGTVIKEGCWEAWDHQVLAFASTILARWGRPGSAPRPIPVAERLPGVGDCDAEGRCWWWDGEWCLIEPRFADFCCTHWLPANALPTPAQEGADG